LLEAANANLVSSISLKRNTPNLSKSPTIHKLAGRLPHLLEANPPRLIAVCRAARDRSPTPSDPCRQEPTAFQAERLGSLEIEDEFESRRMLHRKVIGLFAAQNAIHIG
jgi:hypothetical protein